MLDHAGTHRIQDDVPRQLEQIRLAIDELCQEATLKERTDTMVPAIEVFGVVTVEALHSSRERWLYGFDEL